MDEGIGRGEGAEVARFEDGVGLESGTGWLAFGVEETERWEAWDCWLGFLAMMEMSGRGYGVR